MFLISDNFSDTPDILYKLSKKRQEQMANMWLKWWAMQAKKNGVSGLVVPTPHGDITIIRKDTVAFSVVKTKHFVKHHRQKIEKGSFTHIEHRKIPQFLFSNGWSELIASYDLCGNKIEIIDTRMNTENQYD